MNINAKELRAALRLVRSMARKHGAGKAIPLHLRTIPGEDCLEVIAECSARTRIAAAVTVGAEGDPLNAVTTMEVAGALVELPGDTIALEVVEGSLHAKAGAYEMTGAKLLGPLPAPEVPLPGPQRAAQLDGAIFAEGVLGCLPFVMRNEIRPNLAGVYVRVLGGRLRCETTDGHRAMHIEKKARRVGKELDCLLRYELLELARPWLRKAETAGLTVWPGKGKETAGCMVRAGALCIRLSVSPAKFPDLAPVFPEPHLTQVTVQPARLLKQVQVWQALRLGSGPLPLLLEVKDGRARMLTEQTSMLGQTTVELEATVLGPSARVGFNAHYLADYLRTVQEQPEVRVSIGKPLQAARFDTPDGAVHVIMPLRVEGWDGVVAA